jgi:hypothetical protein
MTRPDTHRRLALLATGRAPTFGADAAGLLFSRTKLARLAKLKISILILFLEFVVTATFRLNINFHFVLGLHRRLIGLLTAPNHQ